MSDDGLFTNPINLNYPGATEDVIRAHEQLNMAFDITPDLHGSEACKERWDQVRALARSLVIAMGVEDILKPVGVQPTQEEMSKRLEEGMLRLEESSLKLRRTALKILNELRG